MAVAHKFSEKLRTSDVQISESVDFAGLLLSQSVLNGLHNAGFERPSPIQLKAIPLGRCGLDLIVQAKSGTGKTCVFSVITLESIDLAASSTQALVLAPTREIAIQIWEVIQSIGSAMPGMHCHTFIGGLPVHEDKKKLQRCHIAVGTPGRIQNLIEQGCLKTESIRLFILDEADKLLEDSFQAQINWIYSALPDNKQMLALSATYPEYLADHLTKYMRNPTFIRLNITDPTLLGIKQYYTTVPSHPLPHRMFEAKTEAVIKILSGVSFHQCLIFSNMQTRAQNLESELTSRGWPTTCIAGNLDQKERITAMAKLKSYQCRVLISTDLTSRGIDADRVNLVVNLDVPRDHETYLHRIGRAGRFGSYGAAVTIVSEGHEMLDMQLIERKIGTHILPTPDPIPSDLVQQQLKVSLDDVVSTEQLITRAGTREHISCNNFSPRSDPKTADVMHIKNGSVLAESCSRMDGERFNGIPVSENKASCIPISLLPKSTDCDHLKQEISEEIDYASVKTADAKIFASSGELFSTEGNLQDISDSGSVDSVILPDAIGALKNALDTKTADDASNTIMPAIQFNDKNLNDGGGDSKGDAGDDGESLRRPRDSHFATGESSQEAFCSNVPVFKGDASTAVNRDSNHDNGVLLSSHYQNNNDSSFTSIRKKQGLSEQCTENVSGVEENTTEIDYGEKKPSPAKYKKSHSAASTWSEMLSETSEEPIQNSPNPHPKSSMAASIWTNMLASDLFNDSSMSPPPSEDSFSFSTPDSSSSCNRKWSTGKGRKKQADVSYETELQMYIKARAKMEEQKGKDRNLVTDDLFSSPTVSTERPTAKAKRRCAAESAKLSNKAEHDLNSCNDEPSGISLLPESPCSLDRNGATRTSESSLIDNSEKETQLFVKISGKPKTRTKTKNGPCEDNDDMGHLDHEGKNFQAANEFNTVLNGAAAHNSLQMDDNLNYVQNVLSISLPPAPKISLSPTAGPRMNRAALSYSSVEQDYKNFLEKLPHNQTPLLAACKLVQNTTVAPVTLAEKDSQDVCRYLEQFHLSLAEKVKGFQNGGATVPKPDGKGFVSNKPAISVELKTDRPGRADQDLGKVPVEVGKNVAENAVVNRQFKKSDIVGSAAEIGDDQPDICDIVQSATENGDTDDQSEKCEMFGAAEGEEIVPDLGAEEDQDSDIKQNEKVSDSITTDIGAASKGEATSVRKAKRPDWITGKLAANTNVTQKPQRSLRLKAMCVCGPATENMFGFMKNSGTQGNIAQYIDERTEEKKLDLDNAPPSMQRYSEPEKNNVKDDVDGVPWLASQAAAIQQQEEAPEYKLLHKDGKKNTFSENQQIGSWKRAVSAKQSETYQAIVGSAEDMGKGAIPKRNVKTGKSKENQKQTVKNKKLEVKKHKQKPNQNGSDNYSADTSSSSSTSSDDVQYVEEGAKDDTSICFQNPHTYESTHGEQRKKLSSKALKQRKEQEGKERKNDKIFPSDSKSNNFFSKKNDRSSEKRSQRPVFGTGKNEKKCLDEAASDEPSSYKAWLQSYYNYYYRNTSTETPANAQAPPWSSLPHYGHDSVHRHHLPSQTRQYAWSRTSHFPSYPPAPDFSPSGLQQAWFPSQNYLSQQPHYAPHLGYPLQYLYPGWRFPPARSDYFDPYDPRSSWNAAPSYPGMATPFSGSSERGDYHIRQQYNVHNFLSQGYQGDQHCSSKTSRNAAHYPRPMTTVECAWANAEKMQTYIRQMAKFYARFVEHES